MIQAVVTGTDGACIDSFDKLDKVKTLSVSDPVPIDISHGFRQGGLKGLRRAEILPLRLRSLKLLGSLGLHLRRPVLVRSRVGGKLFCAEGTKPLTEKDNGLLEIGIVRCDEATGLSLAFELAWRIGVVVPLVLEEDPVRASVTDDVAGRIRGGHSSEARQVGLTNLLIEGSRHTEPHLPERVLGFTKGCQIEQEQGNTWLVVSRLAQNEDLHHIKEELVDSFTVRRSNLATKVVHLPKRKERDNEYHSD